MEVFTLCDCDNIINSYLAHYKQKLNRARNQKKSHSVNESLHLCDSLTIPFVGYLTWYSEGVSECTVTSVCLPHHAVYRLSDKMSQSQICYVSYGV